MAPSQHGELAAMAHWEMAQPIMYQQNQQNGGYVQMMSQPPPTIYQSPVPGGGPPTIVVDTSPQAMHQSGYEMNMQQGGNTSRRHTTPRARANSPRGPFGSGPSSSSRGPIHIPGFNASSKVTVQKLG